MLKKYPFYLDPVLHKEKLRSMVRKSKVKTTESEIIRNLIEKAK